MKFTRIGRVAAFAAIGALALTGCGGNSGSGAASTDSSTSGGSLSGTITAGGSSAQANAQAAWATAFKAKSSGVTVNYDKTQGSGGGVTNFLNGSYDFAGSDAALTDDQLTQSQKICGTGGAVDLPIYADGVAIIFNVKGVDELNLDGETIAKIFTQKITKWDDPAIEKLNPDASLPSTKITTVTRSDGSGTSYNFTNYLHNVVGDIWKDAPNNQWPAQYAGSGQKGGSGVVQAVSSGDGTIGYADHSAIGDVKAAKIKAGDQFVAFSQAGVTKTLETAVSAADGRPDGDLAQQVDYSKLNTPDVYPIPLLSYAILCTSFKDATQAKITKAFIGYAASEEGQKVASANAGSAPIPAALSQQIQAELDKIK